MRSAQRIKERSRYAVASRVYFRKCCRENARSQEKQSREMRAACLSLFMLRKRRRPKGTVKPEVPGIKKVRVGFFSWWFLYNAKKWLFKEMIPLGQKLLAKRKQERLARPDDAER